MYKSKDFEYICKIIYKCLYFKIIYCQFIKNLNRFKQKGHLFCQILIITEFSQQILQYSFK